jgi:REP element-mobilizing transposase RayT
MSTYACLHYHIAFSTKERRPWIHAEWEHRLHEYLGGIVRELGGVAEGIGGVEDHVHLLVGLKTTHRLSDFMRELKKGSSKWVHQSIGESKFSWQDGYGVFTVSATARPQVKSYIGNQREHHRVKTFREELIEFLEKAGVEYDPKYLL